MKCIVKINENIKFNGCGQDRESVTIRNIVFLEGSPKAQLIKPPLCDKCFKKLKKEAQEGKESGLTFNSDKKKNNAI